LCLRLLVWSWLVFPLTVCRVLVSGACVFVPRARAWCVIVVGARACCVFMTDACVCLCSRVWCSRLLLFVHVWCSHLLCVVCSCLVFVFSCLVLTLAVWSWLVLALTVWSRLVFALAVFSCLMLALSCVLMPDVLACCCCSCLVFACVTKLIFNSLVSITYSTS